MYVWMVTWWHGEVIMRVVRKEAQVEVGQVVDWMGVQMRECAAKWAQESSEHGLAVVALVSAHCEVAATKLLVNVPVGAAVEGALQN